MCGFHHDDVVVVVIQQRFREMYERICACFPTISLNRLSFIHNKSHCHAINCINVWQLLLFVFLFGCCNHKHIHTYKYDIAFVYCLFNTFLCPLLFRCNWLSISDAKKSWPCYSIETNTNTLTRYILQVDMELCWVWLTRLSMLSCIHTTC